MNSLTKSKLILRINSIICYNPRTLAGTILETSTISCCLLCTPIFIRTQIFYPCPIGRTFVRSFFNAVILYYMKMLFHKFVDKLNFFLKISCNLALRSSEFKYFDELPLYLSILLSIYPSIYPSQLVR